MAKNIAIMTPTCTFLFAVCLSMGTAGWALPFDWYMGFSVPDLFPRPEPPCNKECSCSDEKIDCNGRGFTTVPELTTKQYMHYQTWLDEIDVSYNQITRILDSDLRTWKPISFTKIKFNNNQIVQIEASVFTIFHRSERLSLANNMLTTFPWTALKASSFLTSLDLKNNMLASAPNSALRGQRQLREFNIRNNRFTALPTSFFRYNKQLQKVYLGGNPWRCDCNNNWLRQYMEEKKHVVQDGETIICDQPIHLTAMLAMALPKSTFECLPPHINKVSHYPQEFSLTEGQAAFMTCNASGEEPLTVQWLDPQEKPVTTRRFSERVQVMGGKDALLLMVKHLNMEDMPGYTCKASNRGGSTTTFVPLNITCTSSCPRPISAPKPTLLVTALKDVTSNQAQLTWAPQKSPDWYHLVFGKAGEKKKQKTAVVKASEAGYTLQGLEADTSYTICIGMVAHVSPANCLSFQTKPATNGKKEEKQASSSSVNLPGAIIGGTAAVSFPFVIFSLVCLYLKHRRDRDAAIVAAAAAAQLQQSAMLWHTNRKMTSPHQGEMNDYFTRSDMHGRNQAPLGNAHKHAQPIPSQGMEQHHHGYKPNIPPNDLGHWKMNQNNLTPMNPPQAIYEEACPVIRGNAPPPPIPRDVNISMATEDIYGTA
ncbi:PREDICTED: leucine-rich repeat, immunoglobulin-like domain and transmembrane domain-containing protein 2 [Branchiostoma belcheri]|uniref:Leucine-rich repeat, immunoglobulin-like domain and transmembrane domain-containing protein 2 n=1 Tax=Branchiostoma belcheri TaxID=7741 RepID=A0A6P4Y4J6_BRABE|nr:PREDICTED: leucine-rich repeat, immunoglobulin-like domain and transmembrane domain-containing protein 2 [Branchiostoma belcheri]